ncbi:conserved hypothetical protein [Culex quinquefasciatus]|uniref:Uncharacterized protein n=1 Tax=Culex quinquefasciatus TaxID=7176 RepID=B0WGJ5_CULQU|nr:conserved hypothetical protein [Culex quinquefasciatus]|eukprot:XP_001847829.1 conserved hypothetical protein [Culex quinquefasciatus]
MKDAAGVGRNERGDWRSSQANQPFERADAAWEVFKKERPFDANRHVHHHVIVQSAEWNLSVHVWVAFGSVS